MRLFGAATKPPEPRDPVDDSFDRAMHLTQEVRDLIKERAKSAHPFRQVLGDLLLRPQANVDVALLADAYEMSQEARIFHGPNGHQNRHLRNKFQK